MGNVSLFNRSIPVAVLDLAGYAIAVAAGGGHTCALLITGGVQCWGKNTSGQVGDGTNASQWTPVDVVGLSSGVSVIVAGDDHSCASLISGEVRCWGNNARGQLGDGSTTARTAPVAVTGLTGVSALAAGGGHTCARLSTGGVKCWGYNHRGQLGDNSLVNRTMPVDVSGLSSGVATVTAGTNHSCALLIDGAARCWGANRRGQLGNGGTNDSRIPVNVLSLTNLAELDAGGFHTCASTSGGTAFCWGENNNGQIGDGSTAIRTSPVMVSNLASGVAILSGGANHTCAVTNVVGVCWGANGVGQLGDTTTSMRTTATPIALGCVETSGSYTCYVLSTAGWQVTPLLVNAGAELTFVYQSGAWTIDHRLFAYVGPDGYPLDEDSTIFPGCKVLEESVYGALLGQVANGDPFSIGSGGSIVADGNGPLALRINDQDGCLGDNDGALSLTIAQATRYTLEVTVMGEGAVTRLPDQATYLPGAEVSLTAVASPGWRFTGWSGDLAGTDNPATVTMSGDRSLQAQFEPIPYTLTITSVGAGSVTRNPSRATHHFGEEVTLTALADVGWSFSDWGGDLSGATNPVSLTIDGDKAITATFVQNQHTLTVNPVGSGSVARNPDQPTYPFGATVTLTAVPANGWQFAGWSGDLSGATNPVSLTIDGDKAITATFVQNQHTLTVNPVGSGSVARNPDQPTYPFGATVTLTAVPTNGWQFAGWSGDLSGALNPAPLVMDGDKTVTATFVEVLQPPSIPVLNPIDNQEQNSDYVVAWADAARAVGYELQEQHNGGSWNTTHTGPARSVNLTGKADGDWCYRVRATNTAGASDWSTHRCTTVDAAPRPQLAIAQTVNGAPGGVVALTVSYTAQGPDVSSLLFSIDYDEQRLNLNPTDSDSNCAPDAIQFNAALPASFVKCADFDAGDTSGEIDIRIADFSTSPRSLSSSVLLTMTFAVRPTAPADSLAPVQIALASFGNAQGEINGRTTAGSVQILGAPATIELSSSSNTLVANGASIATIATRVLDAAGRGLPGYPVTFTTTLGAITSARTTDSTGRASATLTSAATVGAATVTASAGSVQQTITVSYIGSAIDGLVFLDHNGNGARDSGEPGLANVTVTLTLQGGRSTRSASTDASGGYRFADLPAGVYEITITPPAGFTMTTDSEFTITVNASDVIAPAAGAVSPTLAPSQQLHLPLIRR
ncbi:MAG: carboxypeptidase regulatory-like domain-containing protein [Caldilineaceae bacterium]|nr:carboxypeptidase regulatory-like domain-containing protein [Caldilineaceae bacterium]